ncbi:MAG: PQQ-binding-like beta-propeller repeat protein [Candidatus Zhuqueibacterota bacterium]
MKISVTFKTVFIALLALVSCAKIKYIQPMQSTDAALNWPMFGGNPARNNVYPGALTLPLELIWHFKASSAIESYLSVVDGAVFFGTKDGRIVSLDIRTGEKIGNIKMDVASTFTVADTNVIIARRYGDKTLFSYDLRKSKMKWGVDAGDISSEPLVFGASIIVTALYNHIDLYELRSGVRIWQTKIKEQIRSSPAVSGNIIVFGADDGVVYAVKKIDGAILWTYATGSSVVATPAIFNDTVYIGSSDRTLYALNAADGALKWTFSAEGQILQSAAVNDTVLLFSSTDSHVYCLNPATGALNWKFEAQSVISTSPLICNDKVVFGSLDRHLYLVDLQTGKELWKYQTRGRIRTMPVVWGDYLIAASENNDVYAFKTAGEE